MNSLNNNPQTRIPDEITKALPAAVRHELSQMTTAEQELFLRQMQTTESVIHRYRNALQELAR
jgi:hypothetical protein